MATAFTVLAVTTAGASAAPAPAAQQVLRVATTQPAEGQALDPGTTSYLDATNPQRALLAPLYRSSGTGGLVPFLASGQPVVSADGRTIRVRLRAGARWSDGRPVVARDFQTAMTRLRRPRVGSFYASFVTSVSKVVAVDARTIRIELSRPDPIVVQMLANLATAPVPTHVIARAGERWTAPGNMVSSGPFVLAARTGSKLTFTRNARWWGARTVRLQRIEFSWGHSAAQIRAGLRTKAFDATPQNVLSGSTATGVGADETATIGAQYAYLNTTNPRLANPAVRRGIALAIDRGAVVSAVGRGRVATGVVPPDAPGATAAGGLLSPGGAPDVAAAQAELAAGGFAPGAPLVLATSAGAQGAAAARVVVDSLARVGVQVTTRTLTGAEAAKVGTGISPTGAGIDILLQGWIADYADPQTFLQLFTCANVRAGINNANYCSAEYDGAAAGLAAQYSWPARARTAAALEAMLTGPGGAFPAVPLYEPFDRTFRQPWVRGFVPNALGEFAWERVSIERH